jgi:nitroreductase
MSGGPVLDAILSRRVTRRMSDEPLDPDALQLILRAGRAAPNAGNRRLQPALAITDPRLLRLVRLVSPGMLPQPPAAVLICLDERRAEAYGFRPGTPGLYIDVGTAAATMLLAAHALGVAAGPVTSFSKTAVARLLDLDEGLRPQMFICLGHATADQPPASRRGPAVVR